MKLKNKAKPGPCFPAPNDRLDQKNEGLKRNRRDESWKPQAELHDEIRSGGKSGHRKWISLFGTQPEVKSGGMERHGDFIFLSKESRRNHCFSMILIDS